MAKCPSKTLRILSDRIKELRKRHRLTQESLAQMSGIAYKYYQDIEGGRRDNLELQTLEKIAGVFSLDAYQLFSEELPPTKLKRLLKAPAPHKRSRTEPGLGGAVARMASGNSARRK